MTNISTLDEFTRYGVATVRGKIITAEVGIEGLRLVDFIQRHHDITRRCDARRWLELHCGRANCAGE